jgi:hypothetical protein
MLQKFGSMRFAMNTVRVSRQISSYDMYEHISPLTGTIAMNFVALLDWLRLNLDIA